jgi:hypothetical protein
VRNFVWRRKQERQRKENKKRAQDNPLSDHSTEDELDRAIREFSDTMKRAGSQLGSIDMTPLTNAAQQMGAATAAWSQVLYKPYRKQITSVEVKEECDPIDISSVAEPNRTMPGIKRLVFVDQDGDHLDPELEQRLRSAASSDWNMLIGDWNADPRATSRLEGHLSGCVYRGDHHFGCTCHPPTIFGPATTMFCTCCEEPRAPRQYALCDLCASHAYGHPGTARTEHEVRNARELELALTTNEIERSR